MSTAVLALPVALVSTALTACSSGSSHPSSSADGSYGSLPTYLPTSAVHPDSVLTGTADRPALTTEGDSVDVHIAQSSVLARVDGPVVPGEGLPYQAEATTCTWTVTLSRAKTAVPVTTAAFTAIDHLGAVYQVAFVPGQPRPPAVLEPGRKVSFELRAVLPTGEGLLRWAPAGGPILASWDFEVEND